MYGARPYCYANGKTRHHNNEALDAFYNSETHEKLCDARSGLYFQSPGYVYSFLNNEINYGKFF